MPHTLVSKHPNKRILLITLSDPFDFRKEPPQVMDELRTTLGSVTETTYIIYDVKGLTINISGIIDAVSAFARPDREFDKQLEKYGRMVFVGLGSLVSIGAKTAARFSPGKAFPIFGTLEEAMEYVQTELANQ